MASYKRNVYNMLKHKGTERWTEISTDSIEEARAANEAGVDIIVCPGHVAAAIRQAAPDVFLVSAPAGRMSLSNDEAIRVGLEAMDSGANAVYTATHSFKRVEAMADVGVPVIGHVGFVPSRTNWIGGPRAVGKTADEAVKVFEAVKNYENAGAIGIEVEVVPEKIATEITKRTSMITLSLGSGKGCDGEYLWAEDILGTHEKHYPRHCKKYRDLKKEYDRLRAEMVVAFKEYVADVSSGNFPEEKHIVKIKDEVLDEFIARIS